MKIMTTIAYVENYVGIRSMIARVLESEIESCKVYVYDNGLDFTKRFPAQNYTLYSTDGY